MRQPGDEIGGYVIEEVLGSGEKGTAYLARHRRLDRRVVIKESAGQNTTETQRRGGGDRGTAFAADLRHPNVVEIIDAGECDDGRTWFAMQYVDGTDLAGLLAERGGLLAPAEAIGIARSVAAGLDYAHSRGLVHGELTPGDVLLERTTGRVVVADFGISGRDASAEEDRRAVARLLSRMLTGRESDGTVWPLPASSLNPSLPSAVDGVLAVAMTGDPATPGTVSDTVEAVARIVAPTPVPQPGPNRSARVVLAVVSAVAALLAAGGVAAYFLTREESSAAPCDSAVAVADKVTELSLDMNVSSFDRNTAELEGLSTGKFREALKERPASKKFLEQAAVTGEVSRMDSRLAGCGDGSAVVQSTVYVSGTSLLSPAGTSQSTPFRISLVWENGRWLVTDFVADSPVGPSAPSSAPR